jgi:5-methyltetrahydrofolate--homocysteine methyltransferase
VSNLLSDELKGDFDAKTRADYARLREEHASKSSEKKLITLEQARANRTPIEWADYTPPKPEFIGTRVYFTVIPSEVEGPRSPSDDASSHETLRDPSTPLRSAQDDGGGTRAITLEDLVPYIDWSPFFHTWELRGRYPAIFDDPTVGQQARELFDDAQKLLNRISSEKLLTARGVYAFWPAKAVGDDVEIYTDDTRSEHVATFHFLRQQMKKPPGQFNHCLAVLR